MRLFCWFLLLLPLAGNTQVKIHSHNDYAQERPLLTALEARAYSIEADVFYRNGRFYVAHSEKEIDTAITLQKIYLQPLVTQSLSNNAAFPSVFLIDMKEKDTLALQKFQGTLKIFLIRCKSPIQILISGERGNPEDWLRYPAFLFDGRPAENYSPEILRKVGMISDSYANYVSGTQLDSLLLKTALTKAHAAGKLFRLWGNPDDPSTWKQLKELGVDLINTDKPLQCRAFFGY